MMTEIKWPQLRRIITFVLGVAIIVDALSRNDHVIGELIIGTILIGVLPLDEVLDRLWGGGKGSV